MGEVVYQFHRQKLKDEVKDYITKMILEGHYKAGDRLIETQIAQQLNISQAPVREALCDMQQTGIVNTKPYKGTYVTEFSLEDLMNVYDVRAKLEGLAISQAISRISEEEIALLENLIEQMDQAAAYDNISEQIELDNAFHELIVSSSGNKILANLWQGLSTVWWTFLGISKTRLNKNTLVKRHSILLSAIRERDPEKAEREMEKHFLDLKEGLTPK